MKSTKIKKVSGIPPALFYNYVAYESRKNKKSYISAVRWNSSLEKYFASKELLTEYSWAGMLHTVGEFGYERVKTVSNQGEFSVLGDTIAIWPPSMPDPVRISYFGDDLEVVYTYDVLTGRKHKTIKNFSIFNLEYLSERTDWANIGYSWNPDDKELDFADEILVLVIDEVGGKSKSALNLGLIQPSLYFGRFDVLEKDLDNYVGRGYQPFIVTKHAKQLPHTLRTYTTTDTTTFPTEVPLSANEGIEMGFVLDREKIIVLTDRELFGTIFVSSRRRKVLKSTEAQKLLSQLEGEIEIDDYIVHQDYGVGVYRGFTVEDGLDYLKVEYAEEDELYVPLEQIDKLTKFIGEQDHSVKITRLGKTDWDRLRKKVKTQVAIAAKELAQLYAQVSLANALNIHIEDSESYKSFLNDFEYTETKDQLSSERDVISDLSKSKPMNRLLIGDVGFGKTEIMMRASYKVVEADGQAVILCPTTVLALQHFKTFSERFRNTPFTINMISRNRTAETNRKTVADFNDKKVDILIGTHRLLSSDMQPKNLGLLIIDEEQRFGVKQKEKIRKLEFGVHTLSVSATPIPRTLSMALSAIKDISMINTPPPGRKPVETTVAKLNWAEVVPAISKELERDGQMLFVHNEVKTIQSIRAKLQAYMPELKIGVAHGQMAPAKLDEVMTDFYTGKFDCLLATTIIENGLDIANVNTIIVNNAHKLGLSQMYQLRGRVGRSDRQAYAHFFYKGRNMPAEGELEEVPVENMDGKSDEKPKLKSVKYLKRLETILSSQHLGAGFQIASRDLEIRGAGNLLGSEQHGSISRIGYGLYMQMLAEEIEMLKAGSANSSS